MGLFKEECVGMRCDNCNDVFESSEGYTVFVDENDLTDRMDYSGWQEINGKWYCPECVKKLFDYDEDKDEYVTKNKEK